MKNPDIIHKNTVCSACGRPMAKCHECGKKYAPVRSDSLTCSGACRISRHRRMQKARYHAQKEATS